MDRKKHLTDVHYYSTRFGFDRLHIGKKKAQLRPAKQFQKAKVEQKLQVDVHCNSSHLNLVACEIITA